MSKKPTAVGVDIFAGGFTLGVRKHFDVLCHLEESDYGVATVKRNMPDLPVYYPVANWPLDQLRMNPPDLIYGNPPCAAWSQMGGVVFGKDWRDDKRVDCTRRLFELLNVVRPKFWVWESVPRAFTAGRELVDDLTRQAKERGYAVTYLFHDAKYLGGLQKRPRFFMVCHKTKFKPTCSFDLCEPAGEALRKLNDIGPQDMVLRPHLEAMIPRLPQGGQLRDLWEKENPSPKLNDKRQVHGRPGFVYYRLRAGEPANTVIGVGIHPTEDRCLTTKEMAYLTGFPADYEFIGSGPENQIGRGVCPPVGAWLAGEIAKSLKANEPAIVGTVMVDYRKPPGSSKRLIF